jgi:methanogenic corrinoid protein MtbC1
MLKDSDVKIVVGGAPFRFDKELWIEVEADAFGNDSSEAVAIVTKMMEEV